MKLSTFFALYASMASFTAAYPGMNKVLEEITARQEAQEPGASTELIGDLVNTSGASLSAVGKSVKNIILGQEDGQSSATYPNVPAKGSAQCAQDTCCIWKYISNDMASKFKGNAGRCNDLARQAVRLGFHDAAGWSKATGPLGGADGSIVLAPAEMQRPANRGLEDIVAQMKTWYSTYSKYGVSMADLIQMGSTTATVVCPLGPRVRSFVGRKDSTVPAPDGLLPSPFESADILINRFQNMTIGPHGLTALIGAHTTSQQRFVDPARAGDPQDGTPGEWDVLYYKQTLDPNAPKRVFKFQSDINLSQDPRITQEFQEFAGNQQDWNEDYSQEYVRLSLLGVFNINSGLTECSKVLPAAQTSFNAPDTSLLNSWLSTTKKVDAVANVLRGGNLLSSVASTIQSLLGGKKGRACKRDSMRHSKA